MIPHPWLLYFAAGIIICMVDAYRQWQALSAVWRCTPLGRVVFGLVAGVALWPVWLIVFAIDDVIREARLAKRRRDTPK